jgi:hypothetical protein
MAATPPEPSDTSGSAALFGLIFGVGFGLASLLIHEQSALGSLLVGGVVGVSAFLAHAFPDPGFFESSQIHPPRPCPDGLTG